MRHGHANDFSQMEGVAAGTLADLFTAAEAIGDQQGVGGGRTNGWKQLQLSDGEGNVVSVVFETEGTGHATAPGGGSMKIDTQFTQD